MSQIENLLKYQQEDEKLIRIEHETASSEERKNYMQAKNFMTKAPEKLDQMEARCVGLKVRAESLSASYEELAEALKDFDSLDEMMQEGADVAFYKKSALAIQEKIKSLKADINSLTAAVKAADEEYKTFKAKVIAMQKQYKEAQSVYSEYKAKRKEEMTGIEGELKKLAKSIAPDIFAKYQTKRNERIFPIICKVNGDRCSKCGIELSLAEKENLTSGGVVECENCHRFLYK